MKNESNKTLSNIQSIKQLNMEVDEGVVNIQIMIIGLLGKNYKIYVKDNNLAISALTWKLSSNKPYGKYSFTTSSFFIPCKIDENSIKSTAKDGILKIQLQRKNNKKNNWYNSLYQQRGNFAHDSSIQ